MNASEAVTADRVRITFYGLALTALLNSQVNNEPGCSHLMGGDDAEFEDCYIVIGTSAVNVCRRCGEEAERRATSWAGFRCAVCEAPEVTNGYTLEVRQEHAKYSVFVPICGCCRSIYRPEDISNA